MVVGTHARIYREDATSADVREHDEAINDLLDYIAQLEKVLEICSDQALNGEYFDGLDFQDIMQQEDLLVEVPSNEDEEAKWGVDTVLTWSWSERARSERAR